MPAKLLQPHFVEKPWGSTHLEPWYRDTKQKIGEVWYPLGPLLFKFLFTTEKLSVQVHPADDYAREHHKSLGKTEMWFVLRADEQANVALGFKEPLESHEHLRQSSQSGKLMDLLKWVPARAGDTFFVPAGTVHAIGAGLALCEIQQNSDVTYRLFDYGRDRELHLDRGVEVSDVGTHPGATQPVRLDNGRTLLADCEYFSTELFDFDGDRSLDTAAIAIAVLEGNGLLEGHPMQPGQVWEKDPGPVRLSGSARLLLISGPPPASSLNARESGS